MSQPTAVTKHYDGVTVTWRPNHVGTAFTGYVGDKCIGAVSVDPAGWYSSVVCAHDEVFDSVIARVGWDNAVNAGNRHNSEAEAMARVAALVIPAVKALEPPRPETRTMVIDPSTEDPHKVLTPSDTALLHVTDLLDETGVEYAVFDFRAALPGGIQRLIEQGREAAGAPAVGGVLVTMTHSGCVCQTAKDLFVEAFAPQLVVEVRYPRDPDRGVW